MPASTQIGLDEPFDVSLVLAGGSSLGAYHLGACESLLRSGLEPGWYLGASIGAVTAAILVGNAPDVRLDRLRTFWKQATQPGLPLLGTSSDRLRTRFNNNSALAALTFGRPGVFGARFPGLLSLLPWMPPDRALRDHMPLARTLERLIDFNRLNAAEERLSIIAIDMESGEEVWFDNRRDRITAEHLLACTALAPLFPPVEIDGRLLCDAGFGNNLPFDRVFRDPPQRDTLCVAVDLYNLSHGRPETLDQTVARVQDIGFAMQSRRSVDALARERDLARRLDPQCPSVILAHLAYRAAGHQRTLKPLDFSRASIEERVQQGAEDMNRMLRQIERPRSGAAFEYLTPDQDDGSESENKAG